MKTIEEIRDWLLDNAVDEDGYLMLEHLDFSKFDGDVHIRGMKVKGNLYQSGQEVKGNLYQSYQDVKGNLYQSYQDVGQDLEQSGQTVRKDYYCRNNKVSGKIFEEPAKKLLKEVTLEELAELGYKLKE